MWPASSGQDSCPFPFGINSLKAALVPTKVPSRSSWQARESHDAPRAGVVEAVRMLQWFPSCHRTQFALGDLCRTRCSMGAPWGRSLWMLQGSHTAPPGLDMSPSSRGRDWGLDGSQQHQDPPMGHKESRKGGWKHQDIFLTTKKGSINCPATTSANIHLTFP